MDASLEVYFSYADKDEDLRKELENHLSVLKQQGLITGWHRRNISAGMEQASEINAHLNTAHIILLLISPDFIASDYCHNVEVKRALERHNAGEARVIPVVLRPVYWKGASFGELEALPANGKPVTSWSNHDEAFLAVAEGIRKVIEELRDARLSHTSDEGSHKEKLMSQESTLHEDQEFDVFLSYAHIDAEWVEDLAIRLEDEAGLRVWLDKWILIAGQPWQQATARAIGQAKSCIVCIGEYTPVGWFKREIERALDRQTRTPTFRVIPLLLPGAKSVNVDDFLELNTWVDFRHTNTAYAFHLLVCGVKGIPPGRWPRR